MSVAFRRLLALAISLPGFAAANTYTVGPGGTHSTINAAINAAIANPGDDEIRVHTGVYNTTLAVGSAMNANTLTITGGWNDGYATRSPTGAADTIVSPSVANQTAASLAPSGGSLRVGYFQFYGAATTAGGGGVAVLATNGASVILEHSLVADNTLTAASGVARGGGIYVAVGATTSVTISDNILRNNTAASPSAANVNDGVWGAGLYLRCQNSATCVAVGNVIQDNTASTNSLGQVRGAAVYAQIDGFATLQLEDNFTQRPLLAGQIATHLGRSLYVDAADNAVIYSRRNQVIADNPDQGTGGGEVYLKTAGAAAVSYTDGVVVGSPHFGVYMTLADTSVVRLTNLTLAGNTYGIGHNATGATTHAYVSNCLVTTAAAQNAFSTTTQSHNLVGVTPAFLAPSLYDFSLVGAQPGRDGGDDAAPGLGPNDVAGAPRVLGAHVDVGAYEFSDRIFADRVDR